MQTVQFYQDRKISIANWKCTNLKMENCSTFLSLFLWYNNHPNFIFAVSQNNLQNWLNWIKLRRKRKRRAELCDKDYDVFFISDHNSLLIYLCPIQILSYIPCPPQQTIQNNPLHHSLYWHIWQDVTITTKKHISTFTII